MTDHPSAGPLERALMPVHEGLRELFHRHQCALLDRDVTRATRWLAAFVDALRRHVRDEETLVLPLYAERGGRDTDSPPEQFLLEHRKLLQQAAAVVDRTAALGSPPDDRELLGLLDFEAGFKNLLLHHDLREGRVLYPRIGEWSSAAEQEALLSRVDLRSVPVDDAVERSAPR